MPELNTNTTAAAAQAAPEDTRALARETAIKILSKTRDDEIADVREVGRIIIDGMFGGDAAAYQKRNKGNERLEAILEEMKGLQTEQHWTLTKLSHAVRLHIQWLCFKNFDAWPDLELSHFYEVQLLKSFPEQKRLLDLAQAKLWSARELRNEVARVRAIPPPHPGEKQPPTPKEMDKVVERLQKFVADYDARVEEMTTTSSHFSLDCRERFASSAKAYHAAIEQVRAEIKMWMD